MSVSRRSRSGPPRRRNFALRIGNVAPLALLVVGLAACTDDVDPTGTAVTTSAPTTAIPATSDPATTVPATQPGTIISNTVASASTQPATTISSTVISSITVPSTTEPCAAPTGTAAFEDGFPLRMSALVGSDIRTGAHPCFERVVIEFAGNGEMPGVRVEYVDDPVLLSPSDETVEIAGDATLLVAVAAWMPSMEGDGYAGPTRIEPNNVEHLLELRQVENFEGMHQWAIGLDAERAFDVVLLDAPPRIVIDVATA